MVMLLFNCTPRECKQCKASPKEAAGHGVFSKHVSLRVGFHFCPVRWLSKKLAAATSLTPVQRGYAGKPFSWDAVAFRSCVSSRRVPCFLISLTWLWVNTNGIPFGVGEFTHFRLPFLVVGLNRMFTRGKIWLWLKIKPPGIGPQVLEIMFPTRVPFWGYPTFDPQPIWICTHGHVAHWP